MADILNKNVLQYLIGKIKAKVDAKYTKPNNGIPVSDLIQSSQTTLNAIEGVSGSVIQYADINCAEWNKDIEYNKGDICYIDIKLPTSTNPKHYERTIYVALGRSTNKKPMTNPEFWEVFKPYAKPEDGIPKTDLASAVQTSLGKADTALQAHQDISGKVNKSGDTMTGTLNINANRSHHLCFHRKDMVKGNKPTANMFETINFFEDGTGETQANRFGDIEVRQDTDNAVRIYANVYQNIAGSTTPKYLGMQYNADGSSYTWTDTDEFRVMHKLRLHDGANFAEPISVYDEGSANGSELVVQAGGNTFIGGGEGATNLRTAYQTASNIKTGEAYANNAERVYITSDNELYLYSNGQTIANRTGVMLDKNGVFRPAIQGQAINLGSSNYPYNNVYGKNIYAINTDGKDDIFSSRDTQPTETVNGKARLRIGYPSYTNADNKTIKPTKGVLDLRSSSGHYATLAALEDLSSDLDVRLPNASGTLALENKTLQLTGGTLTGTTKAPTPALNSGDTTLATTAFHRKARVYCTSASFATAPWFKFASITSKTANEERYISFDVKETFVFDTTNTKNTSRGILNVFVRSANTITNAPTAYRMEWDLISGSINPANYAIIAVQSSDKTSWTYELWYKIPYRYGGMVATVIDEHDITGTTCNWALESVSTSGVGSTSYTASNYAFVSVLSDRVTKWDSAITGTLASNYYGMTTPDGSTTNWVRTTSNGLIPNQAGGAGGGHAAIGTSTWRFKNVYTDNLNGTDVDGLIKEVNKTIYKFSTTSIVRYVSPSGNDSTGDGTSSKPWKSIQYAIDNLPYDVAVSTNLTPTIYLAAGTYTEENNITVTGKRITLSLQGDVTIACSNSGKGAIEVWHNAVLFIQGNSSTAANFRSLSIQGGSYILRSAYGSVLYLQYLKNLNLSGFTGATAVYATGRSSIHFSLANSPIAFDFTTCADSVTSIIGINVDNFSGAYVQTGTNAISCTYKAVATTRKCLRANTNGNISINNTTVTNEWTLGLESIYAGNIGINNVTNNATTKYNVGNGGTLNSGYYDYRGSYAYERQRRSGTYAYAEQTSDKYNANTTYSKGVLCFYTTDGYLYRSLADNNKGNTPSSTSTYWARTTIANELGGVRFGFDGDGNPGYYKADGSLAPFKGNGTVLDFLNSFNRYRTYGTSSVTVSNTVTLQKGTYKILVDTIFEYRYGTSECNNLSVTNGTRTEEYSLRKTMSSAGPQNLANFEKIVMTNTGTYTCTFNGQRGMDNILLVLPENAQYYTYKTGNIAKNSSTTVDLTLPAGKYIIFTYHKYGYIYGGSETNIHSITNGTLTALQNLRPFVKSNGANSMITYLEMAESNNSMTIKNGGICTIDGSSVEYIVIKI